MKTYDCAVIGRTCIDYIAIVQNYPAKNTKVPLLEYKICLGGQGANSAVVLSHLGVKTLLVTPIGHDEHGRLAKKFLSQHRNLNVMITDSKIKTPCAFIWTEQNSAERTIVYEKIQSNTLYHENLLRRVIKETEYILFDHQSSKYIFNVILEVKRKNVNLLMDAERDDPYLYKLASFTKYIVFSKEIVNFLNLGVKQLLKKFIKLGPEIVCCTLGERGAVAMVKGSSKMYFSKAVKLQPVDTTGAGDVFHAGFMYGIIQGWSIEKILSFANKIAGISTKYIGGSSFVFLEDLKKLVKFGTK